MSRSKHTRPRRIRAAERVRNPRAPRGADVAQRGSDLDWPLPRILVHRPRPGHLHPASRAEIATLLRLLGEEASYGLKSITLTRGTAKIPGAQLGRLVGPGVIEIYDQPLSPWFLPGEVPAEEAARLREAGAVVTATDAGGTTIHWPGSALREFLLLDVLLHEIGHHVLQHEGRKPHVRRARTRDHEAFAKRYARRWRERWRAEMGGA